MSEISTVCYKCRKGSEHSDNLGWMVLEACFREGSRKSLSEETFEQS